MASGGGWRWLVGGKRVNGVGWCVGGSRGADRAGGQVG